MYSICFISAAERIKWIQIVNTESSCSPSGGTGVPVGIGRPGTCRVSTRLNGSCLVSNVTDYFAHELQALFSCSSLVNAPPHNG